MVRFYASMIKRGAMTIDDVPMRWREDVQRELGE